MVNVAVIAVMAVVAVLGFAWVRSRNKPPPPPGPDGAQVLNPETITETSASPGRRNVARRQLDNRMTLPPGMVNTRSAGRLPSTAAASLVATNRGTGDETGPDGSRLRR